MRALVYYIAITLDGFIARPDGSFDDFPWDDGFIRVLLERYPETFPAPFHETERTPADNGRFGAVLMGRKTYEVGVRENLTCPYPTLDQYVFSSSMRASPDAAVTLVPGDAAEFVADLKRQAGGDIWLCGGSALATTVWEAGLIDEVSVKVNPVVFGSGIPLFARPLPATRLTLIERVVEGDFQLLRYRVAGE